MRPGKDDQGNSLAQMAPQKGSLERKYLHYFIGTFLDFKIEKSKYWDTLFIF
jgi:hypothetical protein